MKKILSVLIVFVAMQTSLFANPIVFLNSKLKVVYNQKKLTFYDGSSATPFMNEVSLDVEKEKSTTLKKVKHLIWGTGSELTIVDDLGNTYKVSLYESLPFVFLQRILLNSSTEEQRISKTFMLEGQVFLGVAASKLNTNSTAGLMSATKSVGGYMVMSVGNPATNEGVVCAWLTANRGSGIVLNDYKNDKVMLKAQIDYGDLRIPAGKTAETEMLLVGYGADVRLILEDYANAIARNMKIKLPAQPTVYCTWYHGGASNEKKIADNADFVYEKLKPYGLNVMQIDDFWQNGVSSNGPRRDFSTVNPTGPYPKGMKLTADFMAAKGLKAGIWYIPFAGSWYDSFWKDKLDLFLKEGTSPDNYFPQVKIDNKLTFIKEETPYDVRWGGTCLDLTNPKTLEYVGFIANCLSNEWGYKYFKMDGLWTGIGTRIQYVNSSYKDDNLGQQKRFNPIITPIEAYVKGLETIRQSAGKDVFLLGCSQTQNMRSFGPSMGRVDAMRVGPDNGANASALIKGPQFSSRLYFLNKRVWFNDPDPVYVRFEFPEELARTSVSWTSLTGSLHTSSEQYKDLPAIRLDMLRKSMPSHDLKTVRPVDFLENDPPRIWHLTDGRDKVQKDVIGLFNWDVKNPVNVSYALSRIDLPKAAQYIGFDFWANKFIAPFSGTIAGLLVPGGCKIISIRPERDYPQVISTSRHLTQGMIDLTNENWDATTKMLTGTSELIAGDEYEIRVVVPSGNSSWIVDNVKLVNSDASITFLQEGSRVRVKIIPIKAGKTNWIIKFKQGIANEATIAKLMVNVVIDLDKIIVKWNKTGGFQYRLAKNGVELGDLPTEGFVDTDVKLGSTYTYSVQSQNWNGKWSDLSTFTVTMPASFIVPKFPFLPQIYLTDLTPSSSNNSKININLSNSGEVILLDGKVQKNGLGTTVSNPIIFTIPKDAKRFVATVSMDNKTMPVSGQFVYSVIGDVLEMGELPVEIARSPVLSAGQNTTWNFDVPLDSRFKEIKLKSEEINNKGGNVNWINAGFFK
jgi:hypothetical protein